jgi:cephalosporin hydroxylase
VNRANEEFEAEKREMIRRAGNDDAVKRLSAQWMNATVPCKYSYHFTWMGRPIIQYPQDILALQEIAWQVKPQLIVETGIAHGGSLVFHASILELIGGAGRVLGIDVDIRAHNRAAIEAHPMFKRIDLIEGSSTAPEIVARVRALAEGRKPVIVVLDSSHTHAHVLRELELYSPLVTRGSYLVVCDTVVEDMAPELIVNRPWGKGNNPGTAVREFLARNDRFEADEVYDHKLLITANPGGYLKCVKD